MSSITESDGLHARVQAFIAEASSERFDDLALAIADYQLRGSAGFRRLSALHGRPTGPTSIPAVPADAFRLTRVAIHPPDQDVVRFTSSGTTGAERGVHAMRTTDTYERAALAWGERALCSGPERRVVVALAPEPASPPDSSLDFMMKLFGERFDGRARSRWLLSTRGVDLDGLRASARDATEMDQPFLLLATSFALVSLLDALGGSRIAAPADTVVMQTGGFKGKSRELDPAELRARIAETFGIGTERVITEYGMTELTSQLYEGTLPNGTLQAEPGILLAPPWLRVTAVDPVSLVELPEGEVGLARFVDLGNVDSAVAIVTQDSIRRRGPGIELIGRRPGAPARGCSLAIEALVASSEG